MQKWIGIGRLDGEPREVEINGQECLLVWLSCARAWQAGYVDSIPLIFVGKRRELFEQEKLEKYDGTLVYVVGELATRVRAITSKTVRLGVCVFVTSLTFWDTASIEKMNRGKVRNETIFATSGLEELEAEEDEEI